MNFEESRWFSQMIFNYKDVKFDSNGQLKIFISTSTTDYTSFSSPNLLINIKNNISKSVFLNYANCLDLIETIENLFKNSKSNNSPILQIDRKYSKNDLLSISFFEMLDERVVKMIVKNNDTSLSSIILPLKPQFVAILKLIKDFVNNYNILCGNILLKSIDCNFYKTFEQIPSLIKNLPTQLINSGDNISINTSIEGPGLPRQIPPPAETPEARAEPDVDNYMSTKIEMLVPQEQGENKLVLVPVTEQKQNNIKEIEELTEDFSRYIGKNIDNITIAHIDKLNTKLKERKVPLDIHSDFVEKVCDNKLEVLEEILTINIHLAENPFSEFIKIVESKMNSDSTNSDFVMIPGINQPDLKAATYLSVLENKTHMELFEKQNIEPPFKVIAYKYNPSVFPEKNIYLSYDLLLIYVFLKVYSNKLSRKVTDSVESGRLFYFNFRCFCDLVLFSFVNRKETVQLLSVVRNRYEKYKQNGFFDYYFKNLIDCNLDLSDFELSFYYDLKETIENRLEKVVFINEVCDLLYEKGQILLPYKNFFSVEQIIKEIIPLEIKKRLNILENEELNNYSDDVKKLFSGSKKRILGDEKESCLEKYFRLNKDLIPSDQFEDVMKNVQEYRNKKFDFEKDTKLPLESLDEKLIKALYVWNPSDSKIVSNYRYFCHLIDEEPIKKESLIKKDLSDSSKVSDEWKQFDFSNLL